MPNPNQKDNTAYVYGEVEFSHITSYYTGKALEEANERNRANNRSKRANPYADIKVVNARVMPVSGDPARMTQAELETQAKLFESKKAPGTMCFGPEIASPSADASILPKFYKSVGVPGVPAPANPFGLPSMQIDPIEHPEGEPARGCPVLLEVHTYKSSYGTPGCVWLDSITFYGEPSWYTGGGSRGLSGLAALGFTVGGAPAAQAQPAAQPAQQPAPAAQAQPAQQPAYQQPQAAQQPAWQQAPVAQAPAQPAWQQAPGQPAWQQAQQAQAQVAQAWQATAAQVQGASPQDGAGFACDVPFGTAQQPFGSSIAS